MKRPVVWFVSAFICGIVLYSYFSPGLLLVMLGCCLYTFFAYRKPIYLILIPALLAGTVSCAAFDRVKVEKPVAYDAQTVKISFTVVGKEGSGRYKIKTTELNGKDFKSQGYYYSDTDFKLFDTAEASVELNAVKNFSNSNTFDYKTFLINKGIFFTASANGSETVTGTDIPKITGRIAILREKVLKRIKNISYRENYGAFAAILTGEKSEISSVLKEAFRRLGLSHLLAVSGMHISILLGVITSVLGCIKIKRIPKALICTVFLIAVIPFMNSSPSVIRAAIMGIILLWADVIYGDNDSATSMSIAAFVILLFRPYSVFDAGCILSFTATAGIVFISPVISRFFNEHLGKPLSFLSVTIAAQIAVIPASIYYCEELSLLSLITNIVFVPVFSLLVILLILACIFPFLSTLLNLFGKLYFGAIVKISSFPNIVAQIKAVDPFIVLSAIPIFLFFKFNKRMKILFATLALVMLSVAGMNIYSNLNDSHIYFINADCVKTAVIKTPEKAVMIAECDIKNRNYYDFENIKAFLDSKGIRKLDEAYFLGSSENEQYFKKLIYREYAPDFPKKCDTDMGAGIKLQENNDTVFVVGKRKIAAFAHLFTGNDTCQSAYETGTATICTVFDDGKSISYDNKNTDIVFNKNGVQKMKIRD